VLNRYLQGVIQANPKRPFKMRNLLMAFLCRSHFYWEYDALGTLLKGANTNAASARGARPLDLIVDTGGGELTDPVVHDRSTGVTPVSLVVHSNANKFHKSSPAATSRSPSAPRNEWQSALSYWDEAPPKPSSMSVLAASPRAAAAMGYSDSRRQHESLS